MRDTKKPRADTLGTILQRPRVVHGDLVTRLREMLSVTGAENFLGNTHFCS